MDCSRPVWLVAATALGLLSAPAWAAVKTAVPLATPVAPWYYVAVLVWAALGLPTGLLFGVALVIRAESDPREIGGIHRVSQPTLRRLAALGLAGVPISLMPVAAALAAGVLPRVEWLDWYGPELLCAALLILFGAGALGALASGGQPVAVAGTVALRWEGIGLWTAAGIGLVAFSAYAAGDNLAVAGLVPAWFGDACVFGGLFSPMLASLCLWYVRASRGRRGLRLTVDLLGCVATDAVVLAWAVFLFLALFAG